MGDAFDITIKDDDGQFLGFHFSDIIYIERDNQPFTKVVKKSEKVTIVYLKFSRKVHQDIEDDFGIELELFVECRY